MENTVNTQATNNETQENNKLIAEFMGWDVDDTNRYDTPHFIIIDGENESFLRPSEMLFHTDWNWLMPVVERIESLNLGDKTLKTVFSEEDLYINSNVTFLILYKECYVNFFGEMKAYTNWMSVTECNSKIEAVYTAVIEFIKWYNANN